MCDGCLMGIISLGVLFVCVLVYKSFSDVKVNFCLEYVCVIVHVNIAAHCVTVCAVFNCFHFMCMC